MKNYEITRDTKKFSSTSRLILTVVGEAIVSNPKGTPDTAIDSAGPVDTIMKHMAREWRWRQFHPKQLSDSRGTNQTQLR
jgi:hypothetical protein